MISYKSARKKREDKVIKAMGKLDAIQFAGACKLLGIDLDKVDKKDYELVPGLIFEKVQGLSDKALKRFKGILEDAME